MKFCTNKINVLYVCRLFNGLETSIKYKVWNPTGVPTIYRMINALDKNPEYNLDLVVTSKGDQPDWHYGLVKKINIKHLSSTVTILYSFGSKFGKIGLLFQETFHLLYILIKILFNRYDCLYVDHANIYIGSIVSRVRLLPVIFRLMGVYPAMRKVVSDNGVKNKIFRWLYRSPFSMVVCTQDGSGIEPWLKKSIEKNVPIYDLINGVECKKPTLDQLTNVYVKYSIPRNKILVLFLGKLEKIKGIYEFLEGFGIANRECGGDLHAIVVGCGNQFSCIKKMTHGDKSVTLIPRVAHSEIFNFHKIADIYISPNRLANLTNANLESMSSGGCIIIPQSQPDTFVDIVVDGLLSNSAVYRIKFPPSGDGIAKAIVKLFDSPELRSTLSNNVVIESGKFITSWDDRIEKELKLIKSIVNQ